MKKIDVVLIFTRIFFALCAALLIVFACIENDPWVIQRVQKAIIVAIEREYKTQLSCSVAYISIAQGRVVLWDVQLQSRDGDPYWEWFASEMEIHCSYADFLYNHTISCTVFIPDLYSYTTAQEHKIAIQEHVNTLFGESPGVTAWSLVGLIIQKAHIDIEWEAGKTFFSADGSLFSQSKKAWTSTRLQVQNCICCYQQKRVMHTGSYVMQKTYDVQKKGSVCTFHGTQYVSGGGKDHICTFSGNYSYGSLQVLFSLCDDYVVGSAHSLQPYGSIVFNGTIDEKRIKELIPEKVRKKIGNDNSADSILDKKIVYQGFVDQRSTTLTCSMPHGKSYIKGVFDHDTLKASFDWHVIKEDIGIKALQLCEGSAQIQRTNGEVEASTNFLLALYGLHNKMCDVSVKGIYNHGSLKVMLRDNQKRCVQCDYHAPEKAALSILYTKNDKKMLEHVVDEQGISTGSLYPLAMEELGELCGVHIWCEQPVSYQGYISSKAITGTIIGSQISLYGTSVPLYISSLKTCFDISTDHYFCKIYDTHVDINQGVIDCHYGVIDFSDMAHIFSCVPLTFSHIHIMPYPDIYGVISGDVVYLSEKLIARNDNSDDIFSVSNQPYIRGYCLFDQVYMRANIFSEQLYQQIKKINFSQHKTCGIDLMWSCREPIRVKTDLLAISFLSNGRVTGTVAQPFLSGSVRVVEGRFNFPYKPLYISFGDIVFEQNSTESFAESAHLHIVARNVIKSYEVSLGIRGTLAQPFIELSSYPVLLDNQIITLLYGGSDEGSIYCMVPNAMVNSLKSMVLGSREESSKAYEFVQRMLKPFQHVRVIPRLSNKSVRGGIKGALSVEIDDRLRATVEKNFDLSDEAAIDIEYDLSDDTIVKCARDERGEYGVEIGSRWHS